MQYPASYGVQNWQREVGIWADGLQSGAEIVPTDSHDLYKG